MTKCVHQGCKQGMAPPTEGLLIRFELRGLFWTYYKRIQTASVCKSTSLCFPKLRNNLYFHEIFLFLFLMQVIITILSFYFCINRVFHHFCHFVWVTFPSIKWLLMYVPWGLWKYTIKISLQFTVIPRTELSCNRNFCTKTSDLISMKYILWVASFW